MAVVHLRALGECALETERGRIGPDSKYVFALGLYLVLERGKRIPRQALVDLLWPDVPDDSQARHRFRQTLLRLKQLGLPVTTEQAHLRLDRTVVTADFDSLLSVNGDVEEVVRSRESFEFLHGYQPCVSEQYATWLDLHRARVELAIQRVFVHALKAARDRGDWPAVEQLALGCLRIDPLNEEATMARAEATAMRGSKAQALRILDGYMDALGEQSLAIGLPAKMLRSRIAERMTQPQYMTLSEAHFVGREAEVSLLTGMLEEAKRGRGSAVLFRGAAGIGKTRLVTEITRIAELQDIAIVAVQCHPSTADRPVGLLADLVAALRGSPGSLGAAVESLALLQRLTEYSEPTPSLNDFGEARITGAAIRRAVFDLFEAVADENALLIAIEDAHWADPFSWKMVMTLAESASRRRVLIVATSRNERSESGADNEVAASSFAHRKLHPLDATSSQELVTRLLADTGSDIPSDMLAWCVAVSEGNPYYLRELLTRWLETHEPFGVPQPLSELVDRRLSRLSADALRVFQACVAFGGGCTVARLERIETTEPTQLVRALEELSLGSVIVSDGVQIRAKHDLLAQAAHQRMPAALKALVHRRIATVLEAESNFQVDAASLWECAHHWELAGDRARAMAFLSSCGRHLVSVGLPDEASVLYRRAMQLEVSDADQYIQLHTGLIAALRKSGLLEQVLREIEHLRAEAKLRRCKLEEHSDIELLEFEARWRTHHGTERIAERLQACLSATDASATHRLHAAYWLLAVANSTADTPLAAMTWRKAEPLVLSRAGDPVARHQLAMVYHADNGDLDKSTEYARLLVQCAREKSDSVTLHRALRNAAVVFRRSGSREEAKAMLYEAFELANQHHAILSAVEAAHLLAGLALEENDLTTADTWISKAEEWSSHCESLVQQADVALVRARLALARGDEAGARHYAALLPDWRNESSLRLRQAIVSVHLAIAVAQGTAEGMETLIAESETALNQLSSRGHQDFAVEIILRAYVRCDRHQNARALLQKYLSSDRRDIGGLPPALADIAEELRVPLPATTARL